MTPDIEGWCCERGQQQGVQVCDECAEISAAYSAAMRPVRDECLVDSEGGETD